MNDDIYDDIAIERACEAHFGLTLSISEVIVRGVSVGVAPQATLFRTGQNAHYLYITSPSMMVLGDVIQIVQRMGMSAEKYLAPHGDDEYFHRIGVTKFKQLFPGKYITGPEDTRYYESLAKYNPALVRISRVKGEILGYVIAARQWRRVRDYSYSKAKVV
jgi:hypothetical protein